MGYNIYADPQWQKHNIQNQDQKKKGVFGSSHLQNWTF